jgi:hypothetical protein
MNIHARQLRSLGASCVNKAVAHAFIVSCLQCAVLNRLPISGAGREDDPTNRPSFACDATEHHAASRRLSHSL